MKRLFVIALLAAGCSKKEEGQGEARPAAKVEVRTLENKPLEQYTDYLATLTSRRAVTLSPQISGYVRSINVKPGTTVKQGAVLLAIDAKADQASLENLVAGRESQRSAAELAKQRLERTTSLRTDGIVSQQDADAAKAAADQANSALRATDALIASQRARVSYYNIVAPFEGVVGNVPVKIGDFVSPGMALTSVTQDSGLEAEVWVPIERTNELTPESLIRVLDAEGKTVVESQVTFVAPRADAASQLILIKASYPANDALKADQLAHVRVVWRRTPGISVPAPSIVRLAGQTFAYVTEKNETGLAAHRVPVELGALDGSEFQVKSGLDAGQQLVTSGVQMIDDGAPIEVKP